MALCCVRCRTDSRCMYPAFAFENIGPEQEQGDPPGDRAGTAPRAVGVGSFVYGTRRKPWIAAVRGLAVAGGFEICLACDVIVASDDARFGLPEVKRSLIAGAGGLTFLSRVLPKHVALEMIATGDAIHATRAHALGLVTRVVAPGEVRLRAAHAPRRRSSRCGSCMASDRAT